MTHDTTFQACDSSLDSLRMMQILQLNGLFNNNYLKLYQGKYHLAILKLPGLMGVVIENDKFDKFVITLCKKQGKIKCFSETIKFLKFDSKKNLIGNCY